MEEYLPESDFLCLVISGEVGFEGEFGDRNLALLTNMLDDVIDSNRDWAAHFLAHCDDDSSAIRAGLLKAAKDPHFGTQFGGMLGLAMRKVEGVETLILQALEGEGVGDVLFDAARFVGSAALLPALEEIQLWWDLDDWCLKQAIESCKAGVGAQY